MSTETAREPAEGAHQAARVRRRLLRRRPRPEPAGAPSTATSSGPVPPPGHPSGSARTVAAGSVLEVPAAVLPACAAAVRRMAESGLSDVAVTSTRRGEGRTTVALGTALSLRSRVPGTVLLLDLDLERPSLADGLRLPAAPGLAEVLRGEAELEDCVQWLEPAFGVVCAGAVDGDAEQLSARFATSGVVARLCEAGHVVVGDLPPLYPHGPGDHATEAFSATLLVVRAGRTPVEEIRSAIRILDTPPAVILNGRSSALPAWLRVFGL